MCLLVIDAAYSEYVSRNDYEAGIELVATTENTVMCRTFSKIHGLASLRVGWMYAPAHIIDAINRIRGPFNVSTPAMLAAVASLADTANLERCARAQRAVARLADRGNRQARAESDAERRELRADPLPAGQGPHRRRRRCVPDQARPRAARLEELQAAARAATDGRHRGGQPAGRRRPCAIFWAVK